jgi:hypothetical protein
MSDVTYTVISEEVMHKPQLIVSYYDDNLNKLAVEYYGTSAPSEQELAIKCITHKGTCFEVEATTVTLVRNYSVTEA